MKRSPSAWEVGLAVGARRSTQNARNGCISVRSPYIEWSQSQTHEPRSLTLSPRPGHAKRGNEPSSRSTWIRFTSSISAAKFPVRWIGLPPRSSSYCGSGATSKLKSYERWVSGVSVPVGWEGMSGCFWELTVPSSHIGAGGALDADVSRSFTYAQFGAWCW